MFGKHSESNKVVEYFTYKDKEMYCEEVPLKKLAEEFKTPLYVVSFCFLRDQFLKLKTAFDGTDHLIAYSMKANSNGAILKSFIREGGGVDVVSGGELARALWAGCDPKKIVFSGVGKTGDEMIQGLQAGILQFNVESIAELSVLNETAESLGTTAPMAIRVNPDVDAKTHASIATGLKKSKFGISHEKARSLYNQALQMKGLRVVGIHCHIGSQLTLLSPMMEALSKIRSLIDDLIKDGISLSHIDIGGGLGIVYKDETPPTAEDYAGVVKKELQGLQIKIILEPGRFLVGNSSILLTKVLYNKERDSKKFVIVDAAENDLLRPALYSAYHHIQPVVKKEGAFDMTADIVGPVCETGDFFARDRKIENVFPGDLLAIMSAGAYGYSMSSTYNSRPRCAGVMVNGREYFIIHERESFHDLIRGERIPDFLL